MATAINDILASLRKNEAAQAAAELDELHRLQAERRKIQAELTALKKKTRTTKAESAAARNDAKAKIKLLIAEHGKTTPRKTLLTRFRGGGGRIRKQTFDAIIRELKTAGIYTGR